LALGPVAVVAAEEGEEAVQAARRMVGEEEREEARGGQGMGNRSEASS